MVGIPSGNFLSGITPHSVQENGLICDIAGDLLSVAASGDAACPLIRTNGRSLVWTAV